MPDFTAEVPAAATGVYEMYMERLDETGAVIGFTTDTFRVVENQNISIERKGPTRIYPRASYPMELTVASAASFDGKLHERVPASFVISSTSAEITQDGDWQIWKSAFRRFAPAKSPPAKLQSFADVFFKMSISIILII